MVEEIGQLMIRQVGLRPRQPIVTRPAVTQPRPEERRVARRRLEEEEKKDPLDTFITKMETFRPKCSIEGIENTWVKFTSWFKDITPPIPILPPETLKRK